jgi:hypothetical protein
MMFQMLEVKVEQRMLLRNAHPNQKTGTCEGVYVFLCGQLCITYGTSHTYIVKKVSRM